MSWSLRLLLLLAAGMPALARADAAVVTTPQVRAELVAHAPQGVAPGAALHLGLLIEHQPEWHTYWKNPGDSGLPTRLDWTLPPGFAAGEIQWPTPKKLPIGPLLNYGYEERLLLPVQVTVPAGFDAPALAVKLHAEWLVCRDVCIPEAGDFELTLPAQAATAAHGALFDTAARARPRELPGATARAEVRPDHLALRIEGLPADWHGKALDFLPETAGVIHNAARPDTTWEGSAWVARVALDPQRAESPAEMPAVLVREGAEAGLRLRVAVAGPWPAVAAPAALPPVLAEPAAPVVPAGPPMSLWLALGLALVGGALLNLMPCVFPVLSLKVLGFARHAGERRALLAGGLAYTAGVVASFVALAVVLLALRAGGEQLGWGFQLQSPAVVATLAVLFTLIGLNLAGVFEFGSVLPDAWATASLRHPLADSALTGVLAVAVAAPCTAPFMGASLGYAVTLPSAQALAVFAALGLGMALPYLLASAWPAVARALPRPGPWMATFRALMAFPMFATVVWLLWVVGHQTGVDGATALLGLLLAVAFAAWALGWAAQSRRARMGLGATALAVLVAAFAWALPALRSEAVAASAASTTSEAWQPWSPQRVREATVAGQPVFVDFTAAWCVTCQYNKRTTLADPAVVAAFEQRGVLRLRADWTRRDAAISAELTRLGRSGVPVYALYAPGADAPRLLSEILSVDEVRGALEALR